MIVLLGASGYIGQAFAHELQQRGRPFTALSRRQLDYARSDELLEFLREARPEFLINCAGYAGKPDVDACENARADALAGNTLLPQTIAEVCAATNTAWGHVSSGNIYSGAKILNGESSRVEKNVMRADLKTLVETKSETIRGFTETDAPNFSFRNPPCNFYSGTKALAEEAIAGLGQNFIWRLRIPFDEFDDARNYLTKVQRDARACDDVNSISHRGDFARACLDLWERRAPFGIYNVTNPGWVTTRRVVEIIQEIFKAARRFGCSANDEEFNRVAAKAPRSNCILDVTKLLSAGVQIRPVEEAIEDSLRHWQPNAISTLNPKL